MILCHHLWPFGIQIYVSYLTHVPPTLLDLQASEQQDVDTQASTEVATPVGEEENCLGVFAGFMLTICLPQNVSICKLEGIHPCFRTTNYTP